MKYKKIIIYGGTSEISINLIKYYIEESENLLIFCRTKKKFIEFLNKEDLNIILLKKIIIFEINLDDLEKNLEEIQKLKNDISGVFWVSGYTGNSLSEYQNISYAKQNLNINFFNPVIILTEISKKIIKNNNSFIAVFTSIAGLRGRKKQLFYGSAKSGLISFMSGLRQKLSKDNIHVMTIIPGYMNTKPFKDSNIKPLKFLVISPSQVASKVKLGIEKKREIIFINRFWRIIIIILNLIPEKIFKRLSF